MNKYVIWKTNLSGDYVFADKVEKLDDRVLFIRYMPNGGQKIVAEYPTTVEYHEVEN